MIRPSSFSWHARKHAREERKRLMVQCVVMMERLQTFSRPVNESNWTRKQTIVVFIAI